MTLVRDELRLMKTSWVNDTLAGVTVAIVALPLALGFGITSGAGAGSGLATAIIAGLLAAVLGGSRFQVSGPTGGMTVILVPIIASYGVPILFAVCLVAGIILVLLGLLKTGRFMERIPWSVAEGFTLGIALVIAIQQLPLILGVPKGEGNETLVVAINTISHAIANGFSLVSVGFVTVTLAIKLLWSRLNARMRWRYAIPASAVAVVSMTAVAQLTHARIGTIGTINSLDIFHLSISWTNISLGQLFYFSMMIALLGGVEALLAARVADSMFASRHHNASAIAIPPHRPNRELIGQGIATIASGVFGGMPSTGAIARTGVNVHAGAQTRLAAVIHALTLVVFVFALAPIVAVIPTTVLAGVLLGTSWRIANPQSIIENMRTTTVNKISFLVTAVGVVAIDLIWGTIIGVVVYIIGKRIAEKRGMAN